MKTLLCSALIFTACFSHQKDEASEPQVNGNMDAPCTTLQCLQQHEGQIVDLEGLYVFPKQLAFAVSKLELADGTTIVLSPPKNDLRDHLVAENDGVAMRIRGRIFTGQIPEKYRIIGRTTEPYLLDLAAIEILGR